MRTPGRPLISPNNMRPWVPPSTNCTLLPHSGSSRSLSNKCRPMASSPSSRLPRANTRTGDSSPSAEPMIGIMIALLVILPTSNNGIHDAVPLHDGVIEHQVDVNAREHNNQPGHHVMPHVHPERSA